MDSEQLEIGDVFYKGGTTWLNEKSVITVSSWMYQGVVVAKCSSADCDRPNHFYKFVELQSHFAFENGGLPKANVVLIPSIAQVKRTMMDATQLRDEIGYSLEELSQDKQE